MTAPPPVTGGRVYRRTTQRADIGPDNQPGCGHAIPYAQPLYLDPNYTTNLCTNPSFEVSLAGWEATDLGTTLARSEVIVNANSQVVSPSVALYGSSSLQVVTNGDMFNQGVFDSVGGITPAFTGNVNGSVTCSLFGETGTLSVSAVANPGGVTLATTNIVLNGAGWQTISLDNLTFPSSNSGGSVYLLVTTAFAQEITFYVDGVMYEPESPAHQYVDGDQAGCTWTGTPGLSTSYQQFQYSFSSSLLFHFDGTIGVVGLGEAVQFPPVEDLLFSMTPLSGVGFGLLQPQIALTDFGIWELTDNDPAQTYGWWTNSGASSGSVSYTRIYGMFVPPLDYPVSNGNYAWHRAAYAAVGFQWNSVTNNSYQVLSDVQLELARTTPAVATTPSAYERPRQLQAIIKPNRLNYCTNPAMYVNTTGWTGIGGNELLTVNTSQSPAFVVNYNNLPFTVNQCLQVQLVNVSSLGCQISVPYLLPGETYMCSFYTMPGAQFVDVIATCGTGAGDIASLINTGDGYGENGYGQGPYGGINASNVGIAQNWVQVSFPFISTTDTATLQITADLMANPTYPCYFYVTAVVIEPGDILNPYFDGYSGADAIWETAGGTSAPVANTGTHAGGGTVSPATAGAGRSYYYNQLQYGQAIVNQTLESNTPLGISAALPLYGTPPSQ